MAGISASPDDPAPLGRHLAREGTTAWMPTAVTAPIEKIAQVHDSIATAFKDSPSNGSSDAAAILGMHLEGPFISPLRLGESLNAVAIRSEEHTSELQSHLNLVCRL